MILYCYKCEDCDYKWVEFRSPDENEAGMCPECGSKYVNRDYGSEGAVIRPDIEPGFCRSTGIKYSGRRDRFEKYKAAGFGSLSHSGGIVTTAGKRFYGDEQFQENILHKGKVNQQYLELLQKGVEDGAKLGEQEE